MLLTMVSKLLLLPLCLTLGFLLKRYRVFSTHSAATLNAFIIWIAFPALVVIQVPKILDQFKFSPDIFWPITAAWIAFIASALAIWVMGRFFNWNRKLCGALTLTAGLGNTSFVGFPVIEVLYGSEGIKYALIVDQIGSFFVLSTIGIFLAGFYSGNKIRVITVLKRVSRFPPFTVAVAAAILSILFSNSSFLEAAHPALERLSLTLVPLALVSVGCQLNFALADLEIYSGALLSGLLLKLVILPAAILGLIVLFGGLDLSATISVIEIAMGPMVTGAIIANEFNLEPKLANLMVGIGTPVSLVTVWCWSRVLHGL